MFRICYITEQNMLYNMCHVMSYNIYHVMLDNICHVRLYDISWVIYITCAMLCYSLLKTESLDNAILVF